MYRHFFFFLMEPHSRWDLSSQTGMEPEPPALGAPSLFFFFAWHALFDATHRSLPQPPSSSPQGCSGGAFLGSVATWAVVLQPAWGSAQSSRLCALTELGRTGSASLPDWCPQEGAGSVTRPPEAPKATTTPPAGHHSPGSPDKRGSDPGLSWQSWPQVRQAWDRSGIHRPRWPWLKPPGWWMGCSEGAGQDPLRQQGLPSPRPLGGSAKS